MHPKTIDRTRTFLAKNNFFILIFYYILGTIGISVFISVLCLFTDTSENSISYYNLYRWWLYSFLQLYGFTLSSIEVDSESIQIIMLIILQIVKVILPSLFLGGIIFKFFTTSKIFTFRKKCAIYFDVEKQKKVLAVRGYSSTRLIISDVKFECIARIPRRRPTTNARYLDNLCLNRLEHKSKSDKWGIAITHVPLTLYIPLNSDDVVESGESNRLLKLQSHELQSHELQSHELQSHDFEPQLKLLIVVSGKIPELGTEFIEYQWYNLPADIDWGKFQDIEVDYEQLSNSKKWKGWDNFEGVESSSAENSGN